MKPIEKCLVADIRKVIRFYPSVRVLKVRQEELAGLGAAEDIFRNLNTPEDYNNLLMRG